MNGPRMEIGDTVLEPRKWYKRWWFVTLAVLVLLSAAALWIRTMGGVEVVVDEEALQGLTNKPGPAEFTILTYNVQARPVFDDSKHKFKYISPLLNRFDICAFQECFKDHYRLWEEATHPVKTYHAALKHPFELVTSGLSILGKFPLKETDGIHFADEGDGQNWPASKGVLMARFDVNGMPLDVYTTHIAAGRHEASMRAKFAQGDDIIRFIGEKSPANHSVILLGDFNMRPSRGPDDKEAYKDNPKVTGFDRIVSILGMRDASDEINGPTGTEIDRILFRPGEGHTMRVLNWQHDDPAFYDPEGKPLSDHEPVFVRFQLARE